MNHYLSGKRLERSSCQQHPGRVTAGLALRRSYCRHRQVHCPDEFCPAESNDDVRYLYDIHLSAAGCLRSGLERTTFHRGMVWTGVASEITFE